MTTTTHSVEIHPPTLDELRRHAQRFGIDCVIETARDYLTAAEVAELELDMASANGGPRRRRTTTALREQVEALARRGLVRSAIADTLNISDRRVAAMLATGSTHEIEV